VRALKKRKQKSIASHKLDIAMQQLVFSFYPPFTPCRNIATFLRIGCLFLFFCFFLLKKKEKDAKRPLFFSSFEMCRYVNIAYCPKLSVVVKVLFARTYFHVKAKYTA
jgi:hypothetical protein